MRITAIIERGSDGTFSVFSGDRIGNSYFGGFGENAKEAKEDFEESVKEAFEETSGQVSEEVEIDYRYDIPSLFGILDFVNVSKFAKLAGINESKMRAYKSGLAFPGEKTLIKISGALKEIGKQIETMSLTI